MITSAYCTPIPTGHFQQMLEHWSNRVGTDKTAEIEHEFWDLVGLESFQAWVQHCPSQDFYIHALHGADFGTIRRNLAQLIEKGYKPALGLHRYYLESLGVDYADLDSLPILEEAASYDSDALAEHEPVCRQAYRLPLQPEMVDAHRAFCQSSNADDSRAETFERLQLKSYRQFIQTGPLGTHIISYAESLLTSKEWNQARQQLFKEHAADGRPWIQQISSHIGTPLESYPIEFTTLCD